MKFKEGCASLYYCSVNTAADPTSLDLMNFIVTFLRKIIDQGNAYVLNQTATSKKRPCLLLHTTLGFSQLLK